MIFDTDQLAIYHKTTLHDFFRRVAAPHDVVVAQRVPPVTQGVRIGAGAGRRLHMAREVRYYYAIELYSFFC